MPEHAHKPLVTMDPACVTAVAALEDDPFYRSICTGYLHDVVRRRAVLQQYFDYSIQEGRDIGRAAHLADPAQGVAVWLLPQAAEIGAHAARNKRAFLETTLDPQGCANYYRILEFMSGQSAKVVNADAWYLSIIAVDPASQGKGLGQKLAEPTLAEADQVSAACYLETFTPRNLRFYERLGFRTRARFTEPTTGAEYALMFRNPVPIRHP